MSAAQKTWWAPLWRGLVVDPEGKHYRRLKSAVWLLLYLILHADRPTGRLPIKLSTVAKATGIPLRTVERWAQVLRHQGYLTTEKAGRVVWIAIRRWKPLPGASKLAALHRQIGRPRPPETSHGP